MLEICILGKIRGVGADRQQAADTNLQAFGDIQRINPHASMI